jgi:hypothetical protein
VPGVIRTQNLCQRFSARLALVQEVSCTTTGLSKVVVDLAFREHAPDFSGWTVLDFKTDREFAKLSERYEAQLSIDSEAIRRATSLPSRGILLMV